MWQDYVFTFSSAIFSYSLIPQIRRIHKSKTADLIAWQTIMTTSFAIILYVWAAFSLKLYISCCTSVIQFSCCVIMAIQKVYYGRTNHGTPS